MLGELKNKNLISNFTSQKVRKIYFKLWAREVCNPAQTLPGPRARAEGVSCRGRMVSGQCGEGDG